MTKELKELYEKEKKTLISHGVDYAMYDTHKDKEDYDLYKTGELVEISSDKKLEMKVLSLLEQLGYPMHEIGTYFYKNMITKVLKKLSVIEEKDPLINKELKSQLEDTYSQFYVDVARNDLDIGVTSFHMYIMHAIANIDYSKADPELLIKIYSNFPEDMNHGEQAFALASFLLGKMEPKRQTSLLIKRLQRSRKINLDF